jgi:Lar family restriction alleviation protein
MGDDFDAGNPPPENFYSRQWGARMTDLSTAHAGELRACPFCGKRDAFVEQSTFASSYVICNNCMARGPDSTQDGDDEDEPGRAAAIAAWNTRPAAPDVARLEDRVKALEAGLRAIAEYRLPLGLSAAGHARALLSGGEG